MAFTMTLSEENVYPPLPSLADEKAKACKRVDFITSVTILNGFDYTFNGKTYHFSFNTEDQANFVQESIRASTFVSAGNAAEYTATWRGHLPDGTAESLTLNITEFQTLLLYSGTWKASVLSHGWDVKNNIRNCESKSALTDYLNEINLDVQERDARDIHDELQKKSEFNI